VDLSTLIPYNKGVIKGDLMDWDGISLPHRSEDIPTTFNDKTSDLTYTGFTALIEAIRDLDLTGELEYSMWLQDDTTDNELMVLNVTIRYKDGDIIRYDEELSD
jgi:hypothetical protein